MIKEKTDRSQEVVVFEEGGGIVVIEKLRVRTATLAVVFALLANTVGFTWGVFRYHQGTVDQRETINELSTVITELSSAIRELQNSQNSLARRLDLLEERERLRFPR